jgi:hypothetical protein
MSEQNTKTEGIYEGWSIIELMGHRKLGGYLSEQTIAGEAFIRIDVVNTEGVAIATQFYSASAVYCITPVTQDVATAFGTNHKPEPVTLWELPPIRSTTVTSGQHSPPSPMGISTYQGYEDED